MQKRKQLGAAATVPVVATAVAIAVAIGGWILPRSTAEAQVTPTAGDDTGEVRSITGTGTGRVRGTPDTMTIDVGVETRAAGAQEALARSREHATNVIETLRDSGVDEKDLQTSQLSIWPVYDDEGAGIVGYEVANSVTATLHDLDRAGEVIDAAAGVAGDAIRLHGVWFSIEDTNALVAAARADAVKQARDQAKQLADAAGVGLGDVLSIEERRTRSGPRSSTRMAPPRTGPRRHRSSPGARSSPSRSSCNTRSPDRRFRVVSDVVLVDSVDGVCTITLNRPEVRNALDTALQRASAAALEAAEADDAVSVVVLTGANPAFCAGLDLRELGSTAANLVGSGDEPVVSPFTVLWTMAKPVIGAVNGPAVTGGFELALACDFLVASERARFGDTHARVGVTPGGGMSVFLPQAVGLRRAKEMSLTGNFVDAAEAAALGLVNHVVPHHDLMPTAHALAADIAANDQHAVRNLKRLYDRGSKLSVGDAIELEQEVFRSWRVDPAEIERRRTAVVARGRGQRHVNHDSRPGVDPEP
jgi:enoyl-CoA hydratase